MPDRAEAIKSFEKQMHFYKDVSATNQGRWMLCLIITVVGSALGTIASAINIDHWYLKAIAALPAAAAGIAATLNSVMNFRGDYTQQAVTFDALDREFDRFNAGVAPYEDSTSAASINLLMIAKDKIVDSEVSAWQALHKRT